MNICITSQSAKNFIKLFEKEFVSLLSPDILAEDLISLAFSNVVEKLSTVNDKQKVKEITLQHLGLGIVNLMSYIQKNPKFLNYKSVPKLTELQKLTIDSVFSDDSKFQDLMSTLSEITGNIDKIVPFVENIRYNAISLEFSRTTNQLSIYEPGLGYSNNITDPQKVFEENAIQTILSSEDNIKFKMIKFDTIKEDNRFVKTSQINPKDYVLIAVNINNEYLGFSSNGKIDKDGKYPIFTFKQYESELIESKRAKIESQFQYESQINPSVKYSDIEEQINKELAAYLSLINEAKSQNENGQNIYFDIQKNYSNSGFVELNRNSIHSLSSINNISNSDIFGTSESKGVSYFIKPNNVKRPIRLFEKSWLSFSDNEIESLHYLLTEENPRVVSENGTVWEKSGKKVAQDLLKTYFGSSSSKYIELNPVNKTIRLFDRVIELSKLTVEDLKKASSNRNFDQVVSQNILSKNKNVKVLNSFSEVTEIGQWYKDGDYVKEAVGIRRSYGGVRSLDTTVKSIKEFRNVNGVKEIVLNAKDIPFRQFVYNTSYIAAKLNGNNELKGGGAYLVFKPSLFSYSEFDDDLKFFSKTIESVNSTDLDNLKALEWFKNSPLSEVVSLLFSDKNLNQGPKHLASFLKNTITLNTNAPGVVVYHEAFHAYFNGILSSSDREKVFSELRKEKNSFNVTIKGNNKTVIFLDATDLELEEYLAEEFRNYATSESSIITKKSSLIKSIFDKILQAVKSFFGKASYSELVSLGKSNRIIDSIFDTLYQGKFNTSSYNSISTEEKYFSTKINDISFSAEELELLDNSMLSLTSLLVGQVLNSQMTSENRTKALVILNKMISVSETSEEYKKLQEELDSLNSGYPRGFGIVELNKPEILKINLNFIKKALALKLKVFKTDLENNPGNKVYEFKVNLLSKALNEEVLGSSNSIQEYLLEKESSTLFSRFIKEAEFLNLNKKYLSLDQEIDETEEVFVLGADQYNNDVSELNALEKETKVLLSSIQEYTNQGTGVIAVNNLGFPKLRTLSYMQYKIGSSISNSVDALEMNNKLRELSKTDREINQVFSLLGDLEKNGEDFTDFEHKQWNDFYHSFNKFLTPFTTVVASKKNIFEPDELNKEDVLKSSELQISTGQIGQDRQQVVQVWKSKFNYLLESSSPYVEVDEFGKKYLNLEYVLNDYTLDKDKMFIKTNDSSRGPLVTPVLNGLNSSDYSSKKNKASWDAFNFLKELGLEIIDDSRVYSTFIKGDLSNGFQSGLLDYLIEHLQNRLKKGNFVSKDNFKINSESNRLYSFDDIFKSFTYQDKYGNIKNSNQFGTLKQLSKLHYMYSNDSGTFMAYNAEGNKQNQMSYPSSLYNMVKVMNKVSSYQDLINIPGFENFNLDNNILIGTSPWFKAMFNLFPNSPSWGKRNFDVKINVELLGGSKFIEENVSGRTSYLKETGVTPMSSDEITKFISDVALTFDNKQETPRAEAKSTSVSVSGYVYKESINELRGGVNLVFTPKEVSEIMSEGYEGDLLTEVFVDHLEAELLRLNEINKAKEIPSLLFDASYLNRGLDFQFFDDILDSKLKNDLINLRISDLGDLRLILNDEPLLKKSFEDQLKNYFIKRSDSLAENKISVSFPQSLLDKVKISATDNNNILLQRMLQTFLLNNVVNNLNYSSLFLGDFSNYNLEGEDFHKRIAGLISTGKSFRDDNVWLSYLNKNSYSLTKKLISENEISADLSKTNYDATLSTAIIKEKKSKSIYSDYYKEYLGIDNSEYNSMTEADGQGWLSLDAYRILSLSSNEWSDRQEKLYRKIISGEILETSDIQTTFPVRKFQYYGPVQGGSSDLKLGLNAFHKYSLAPLVPSLIKNTPLEQLHLKMMEQGIDYVTMESGTKLGKIAPVVFEEGKFVNNVDVFYNDDRTVNSDVSFTKNIIHTKYLKNQLYLAEGYKGKITLPTQVRKIILLGLFNSKIPTDFIGTDWNELSESEKKENSKHYDWVKRYEENLKKMTKFLRTDLESSLGLSLNSSTGLYEGDSKKLINELKLMLEDKELLSSEIDSLIDENTGELIEDLSVSLQVSTIEKLLVQMVDKKLRRLKINGESLVQVSGAMYESIGVVPVINKEGQLKYGSNQLKFYHAVDKEGNPVEDYLDNNLIKGVSKMEVIISLQGDYKNLFELIHTDGKKIKVFDQGKVSYEKSLDRLNEMLDSEEFRKQHESLLTMPGVRIPTQGPNSLFIPTVRKFLPEYAGPIVILPIEIVAQSGSDFDIDKMFAMMKNIGNYNGEIEEIKYIPSDKNIDELKSEITELKKELNFKNKLKSQAFKDFVDKKRETDSMKSDVMDVYNMLKEINSLDLNVPISDRDFITKLIDTQKEDLLSEMDNIWLSYFGRTDLTKEERNEYIKTELGSLWENYNTLNSEVTDLKNKISSINKVIDQNSIKGLENEFMDLISEKVTMVSNLKSLVTANTVDSAKPLANKVLEKRKNSFDDYNKRSKLNSTSKNVSRTEAMMYEYNLYKHQENSVSKDSLGIAAVIATFHALFTTLDGTLQQNEKSIDDSYLKALDIIKNKNDKTNLSALGEAKSTVSKYLSKKLLIQSNVDSNGNLFFGSNYDSSNEKREISDIISQLINGYVDVAKDAWIFLIEGNKENTPILLTMILAGVPIEDAVNLCTHPLVRKYTKLKQTLKGPFANMTEEKSSFTSFEVKENALDTIFKYYVNPITGPVSFSYINNTNEKPFSSEELEQLNSNSNFGQRDVELFAQYLHIEKIADELTTLTSLTKFDTQKISSVSEAVDRISNTVDYSKRSVNETFFGNKYLNALEKSIVGNFNNDSFISNVFDKQFNIRNNKVLTNFSLQLKKKDLPKGVDLNIARTQFKNDFILFLYQNSVYSGDTKTIVKKDGSLKNYTLEKHDSPLLLIEDDVVYYNDVNTLAAEITKPEYSHVRRYFLSSIGPNNLQVKNFIGFVLEYQNLLEEYDSLTTEELSDKFFMFDKPDNGLLQYGPDAYKRMILQRAAMFYSGNPESMFDSDMGVVPIINQLKSKYPELTNYSLIRDLRWDYDSKRKKYNLFLPSLLNDTTLLKAYKENLKDLSNHSSSEVRSVFNESYFSHLGIMQTGLSRNVKHDIARVGNPKHLQNELLFSKTASKIKTTLDQAVANYSKNLKEGVKDNSQYLILSQYFDLYKRMLSQNLYFSKNNGLNYTISDISYVESFTPVNSDLVNKVSLVPIKDASYKASDFDSIENLEEFIKELSDKGSSFVRLPNTKIILSNASKQFYFDKYLEQYLNVDNSADAPKIILKSKYSNSSGLDIGSVLDSIKSKSLEKSFNVISSRSSKIIGVSVSNPNKNFVSSASSFLKAVEKDLVLSESLNKQSYLKSDSVFIISDSFNERAYSGYTVEQYQTEIQNAFDEIKKLINLAISNSSTLNVLPGSGVNELVRDYLYSSGYLSKTIYVDNVKYYQFGPYENFESFEEGVSFNIKQNDSLYDIIKDFKQNSNFVNDLSKLDSPSAKLKFLYDSFNTYLNNPLRHGFRTGVSYRKSIISELFLSQGQFEIGNSEIDILFEQLFNRLRKNLKDKAGKTSFFTLIENYNSKQQTFESLTFFTEQQKESILKKLSLTYPEVFSDKQKAVSIINSLLSKDLESTVENLKNCIL